MDSMKVLGVTFSDPGDAASAQEALEASLEASVIAPIRRLTREVEEGARKGTALFLLHRYLLPVLAYHQGAWGLLASPDAWHAVDAALDTFCAALCPEDLRGRLYRGSPLRRELALPRGLGGLGVPLAAEEAPLVAAGLWPRDRARAAGARDDLVGTAYRLADTGVPGHRVWKAVTARDVHGKAVKAVHGAADRSVKRRLEQNVDLRGGTRAFAAVPWRPELSVDNLEFDVAWRLVFGGVTEEMAERVDHPDHGFRWRGERMEWAFAQALHDCLPPGMVVTGEKPAPELSPLSATDPDLGDRADVDVLTRNGQRFVFDVRTVNVQRKSALGSTAGAQCGAIEREKRKHYSTLYRDFAPFVITLSGAVSHASAGALMKVIDAAAKGDRSVLDWEPARWLEDVLHRVSVEMVKTVAVIATRAVLPPRPAQSAAAGRRGGGGPRGAGSSVLRHGAAVPCCGVQCRDGVTGRARPGDAMPRRGVQCRDDVVRVQCCDVLGRPLRSGARVQRVRGSS